MESEKDTGTEQNTDMAVEASRGSVKRRGLGMALRVIIVIAVIVAVILVAVRIRSISMGPLKTEAAETRLTLEAMEEQDTESIRQEISLKRSVAESTLETSDMIEGSVAESDENVEAAAESTEAAAASAEAAVESTEAAAESAEAAAESTEAAAESTEAAVEGTGTYDYYEEPAAQVYE